MGREVRRVPSNWKHPTDERGSHIPLHGGSFKKEAAEWDEEAAQWENGLCRAFDGRDWRPKDADQDYSFEEWHGERPEEKEYVPDWPESERTHFQMYETVSEGTPISPVFATKESLANWLATNNANAGAGRTVSYEAWLQTINSQYGSPSLIIDNRKVMSGVEAIHESHLRRLATTRRAKRKLRFSLLYRDRKQSFLAAQNNNLKAQGLSQEQIDDLRRKGRETKKLKKYMKWAQRALPLETHNSPTMWADHCEHIIFK